jgi:Domain of unknown function (DUF4333)
MSGPQGPDQTQPWPGQDQPSSEPSNQPPAWQQPAPGGDQPTPEAPSWQQPPAYQPQQYPQYQQPGQPPYTPPQQYPPTEQFGQQPPTDYSQQAYPQYGQQPGQYPQQPGPYGQYGQAGQFGPYTATGTEQGSKRSAGLIIGIIAVLGLLVLAAVAVVLFWIPGFLVTTKLDVNAAQSGVEQILTDEANGYGAKNVEDVKCNDGQSPTVKKGDTFDCEVSIDGTKRQVTVTFQDDDGTYEVGRPK